MTLAEIKKEITPNSQQQKCIDNINGKYLVLAGPGTGKTFTVIQRIKAMLEKGIESGKILCLTFSEAAVSEMKKKLAEAFDTIDIDINIYTYHGFCNEIIANNSEEFNLSDNVKIVTNTIKQQLLKECIDEYQPKYLRNDRNDPYAFFAQTFDKFSQIKKSRMTKEKFFNNLETNLDWKPQLKKLEAQLVALNEKSDKTKKEISAIDKTYKNITNLEEKINKIIDVWNLYELFQNKMDKENYIDFDDMIALVLDKFESSPEFLDNIANKYEYIMVDEYQDTNDLQNKIVFNLVHALKSQNIFVVGDDDQIIYSFQGANLDTIGSFLTEFPDTKVICLKENMRSTQNILDVARQIAINDYRRLEVNPNFKQFDINKELIAKNESLPYQDRKVRLTKYNDQFQEFVEIVSEIENLINSDECPKDNEGNKKLSEIAVICTQNVDLRNFADILKDRNIRFELKDGNSIFLIKSSVTLYYYLQMLANSELYCDKVLKLLLLPPFEINPIDFAKIYERISNDKTFIASMETITDWVAQDKIQKFLNTYYELKKFNSVENVRNTVLEVGNKTGIFNYFINEEENKLDNIAGLKKLVDEASEFSKTHNDISLEAFVEYLKMIQDSNDLDILTDKPPVVQNAVQLTTYHSSKGKEYEYVYMPDMQSNRWESSSKYFYPTIPVDEKDRKDKEYWDDYKQSDRIKNIYVGMTRAKHTLRLSYVTDGSKKPSKWIIAASDLMETVSADDYTLENYSFLVQKAIKKNSYDYKRDFSANIKSYTKDKHYSPTAVNVYLKCPRQYLYSNILKLEARVGFADAANYGSAVHNAINIFTQIAMQNNSYPEKGFLIEEFKKQLNRMPLSSKEQRKILLVRGENELSAFYHHLTDIPICTIYNTEYPVDIELDGIKFHGRIDKIEKNPDGTFTIIDYKTGKSKTTSSISPNGEHEDYYNQICLYKYYLEKQDNIKVKEVKFLFPVNSRVCRFEPTEEECQLVVDKFKSAIKSIENCEFEPKASENNCQYCQYKDFCMMNAV